MGKPFTTGDLVNIVSYDSAGNVTLPASLTLPGNLSVFGRFFDSYSSPGTAGQFLKSTGTGTEWVNITASGGGLLGSGVATRIAFWQDSQTLTSNANLYWDNTNSRLGIGTASPVAKLQISSGDIFLDSNNLIGGGTAYNSVWNRINFYNGGTGDLEITLHSINWYLRHNANATFAGNVGIGTTNPSTKLDVNGNARIQGGSVNIGTNLNTIIATTLNGSVVDTNGIALLYASANINATPIYAHNFYTGNFTSTSGIQGFVNLRDANFAPTSGTAVFNTINATPLINQTGGANGVTRGLYINPTLTAAADWRSLEWNNNTGWGLYGAGTASNYLNGNLGIGTTATSATSLRVARPITGSNISYGIIEVGTIQSDVTASGRLFYTGANTQATAFTLGDLTHYFADQGTIGAGSAISVQVGFRVGGSLVGANQNFGFYGDIPSGTNRWNLYMNGTANNYLNGNLGIGTTAPTGKLDVSAGLPSQTAGDLVVDTANNTVYIGKLDSVSGNTNLIFRNRLGGVKSKWFNAGSGSIWFGDFTNGFGLGIQQAGITTETTLPGDAMFHVNKGSLGGTVASFINGNVGIGTTAPSSTLDVKGSGNTSATTALTVQNSDGTVLFQVTNGQIVLFNTARTLSGAMLLQSSGGGNTTGFAFGLLNPFTATSGSTYLITNASSFEPTSGTGTYTFLSARPTINQTGGANGITRGIHVQPTLTAAADWRSIEWSNNTGYGLYGAGTAKNYLAGSLGIGTTSPSQTLTVSGNAYITGAYYDSTNTSGTSGQILSSTGTGTIWIAAPTGGGSGTVTSVAALTIGTTGTDLSSTVANSTTTPVITLNVPTASATNRGVLSSADWSTFNGKQNTITLTTTGSSGAATFVTNTLNIPNYTLSGLGGEPIITAGTTAQYWRGDKSFQTLNTAAVVESTNLYYTDARSRAAVSLTTTGSSGAATYSSATGVFNIPNYTLTGLGGFANPMTTLGDMIYGAASGTPTRFVGNITTTKQYLSQTGTGAASAAPVWSTITGTDVTGNALTKTDDTNVTLTLGGTPSAALLRAASITVGWTGQLAVGRGGSGASTLTGVLIGNGTSAFTGVAGTANQLLRRNAGDTAYEFFTPTYLTTAITSLNGLTAATQTFTNDTNVTITSATSAHTLGWSGQLSVGRGGSGASTLTGVLIGNGTSAFTGVAGTANQLLRRNAGNTAYEFFTPTYTTGSGTATQVAFWNSSTGLSGDSALYWDNTLKTLGIGTTSPTEKLVVSDNGAAGFEYIPATGRWYRFNRSTLAYGGIYTEASEHTWSINATEHVRLSSGGNFGIGNNNPTYKLDVTGDARIASGSLGVGVVPNATDGRIDASNDIVAYSSSDERLKVNIKPIENAIDKVIALNGVEYDWNPEFINSHGYSGHDIGVIAHEVQAIFPEAVRIGGHGYLMVRYEKLIPLLIQAIKEQQTHIDLLMSKYDA